MATVTLTRPQYDALMSAALAGNTAEVARLRDIIDKANGIKRYFLYVRWQDVGGRPPPLIELGKGWPPNQTYKMELDRPIARADVDAIVAKAAVNPVSVMVTPDRAGIVGWSLIDDYNFATGA